ncbi:SRPBCC family protein [Nocardioides salsibiostraticola]
MDLTHTFTVPTSVQETWDHFGDIKAVGECFPGATVTSADADSFAGSVKVKLGPIALVYNGSGTFIDKDEAAHTFRVDAKGKDKRGNGTAGAKVDLSMTAGADGGTDVRVVTDLAITGKPAQFGRGVMQDVSDKLLGQFVACLEERLSGGGDTAEVDRPGQGALVTEVQTSTEPQIEAMQAAPRPVSQPGSRPTKNPPPTDDSLNLGAAVIPVLLKSYGKQVAAVLAVLAILGWLKRRS